MEVQMASWQQFEEHVRILASAKWNTPAFPETINEVKCDCVLKPRKDYWVVIEITEENSLDKSRTDLGKFHTIKPFLFSKNIFAECYFIVKDLAAGSSLRNSGNGLHVNVMNQDDFCNMFLHYNEYEFNRLKKNFGSAVDIESGENDLSKFVDVSYKDVDEEKSYGINELSDLLLKNKKIVLIGDYGTGKSRCIGELFKVLVSKSKEKYIYPIAINLRECWGLVTKEEIIVRHSRSLGIEEYDSLIIKLLNEGKIILLLDGFDEINAQSWSDDPDKLIEIRRKALVGVRDLISSSRGGVIITGREYYFNSDKELFLSLGFPEQNVIRLTCANEFSDTEVQAYLSNKEITHIIPEWLPKKPLMVQLFSLLDKKECEILLGAQSEIQLCRLFIDKICERETKINSSLDKNTIKEILISLARLTRLKQDNYGPISVEEINDAFEKATGYKPVDESAVMLQRLPGLARFSSESRDRKFIDLFMLDPLRAEDLLNSLIIEDSAIRMEQWLNPLCANGIAIVAQEIKPYLRYIFSELKKRNSEYKNNVFIADIFNALLESTDELDMHDITIENITIPRLSLEDNAISNLTLKNCIINDLYLAASDPANVLIDNCIILKLNGCATKENLPSWISSNCPIDTFFEMNTLAKIKKANLSEEEQLLIATLKRIFFQPGRGRKEQALLKGMGPTNNTKVSEKIIKLLLKEKIISEVPGDDGRIFTPNRKHTKRISKIINSFSASSDPLYIEVKSWSANK